MAFHFEKRSGFFASGTADLPLWHSFGQRSFEEGCCRESEGRVAYDGRDSVTSTEFQATSGTPLRRLIREVRLRR